MTAVTSARPLNRVLPPAPLRAFVTMLALTGVLYVSEAYDQVTGGQLDDDGIIPRTEGGLDGVLWAPLLHGGWDHLVANTLPFLLFGFLAMAAGIGRFVAVTAIIWIVGGLGVWLFAPPGASHIGASGVIFGWLAFLLVRGFVARSLKQIGLAAVLFSFWGGLLWGVLPGQPGISWQGHLFGALAGVLAAWLLVPKRDRAKA